MIYQMMYYSTARREQTDSELRELLDVSRRENSQKGITGLLLYGDGVFFQVLEGVEADIKALYAKIETDDRHQSLVVAAEREVAARSFDTWAMGYTPLSRKIRSGVDSLVEVRQRQTDDAATQDCDPLVRLLVESFIKNQQLT